MPPAYGLPQEGLVLPNLAGYLPDLDKSSGDCPNGSGRRCCAAPGAIVRRADKLREVRGQPGDMDASRPVSGQ